MSAFENFVNSELPKRIATDESPLETPAGMVFVTTGTGLMTEARPYISSGDAPAISTDPDNRARHGSDNGIFVPQYEAPMDPLAYYILAKS